jgi:hypothetical protein
MSGEIAAAWARVSTEPQQTLDSQVARSKAELEKRGYVVPSERILKVDWTSLDLLSCPQFQQLRHWIINREIKAIGVFDRDRLQAKAVQRLLFLSDCRDNQVEVVVCQGPPLQQDSDGEWVEFGLAKSKEVSVLRAQQGSRDALHERATVKGLSTNNHPPFGYYFDESKTRLKANDHWDTRSLIIHEYLKGKTIKGVIKELQKRGIQSPKGKEYWPEPTIYLILRDSVNYGLYKALRRENIEPTERKGNTYGKSSSRNLPGLPLPNIEIEKPIITEAQHEWIQERLAKNKLNATRNGKRDYLLRGMIYYGGDNLRYYGIDIRHISWAYRYNHRDKKDNPRAYLPGRKLEAQVEAKAREILTSDDVLENELGWRETAIQESISRMEAELKRIDRKSNENINAESELVSLRIRNKVSEEAYDRQMVLLMTERNWVAEEKERINQRLTDLRKRAISLVSLDQLRQQMADRLFSDKFEDRRFILEALNTKVIVTNEGAIEVEFTIAGEGNSDGIVLSSPLNACPRYSVVPVYSPLLTVR